MGRIVANVVIIDYCKYHMHYHPFAVSGDTELPKRSRPVFTFDKDDIEALYDASFILMEHKRNILIDIKIRLTWTK